MVAVDAPCEPWCTVDDVFACAACSPHKDAAATGGQVSEMIAVASAWLWRLSGRRFSGECEATVRPVGDGCHAGAAVVAGGGDQVWFDSRTGQYGLIGWRDGFRRWRREGVDEITLGFFPVREIVDVKIDGAVFGGWRLDDSRWLVRTDGQRWPSRQRLDLPDSEPGTWSVTLRYGDDPPADGRLAARVLACELVQAVFAPDKTRLTPRVTSIARQGISAVVFDPIQLVERGRFGIVEVDAFLASVNPHGLTQRAVVMSPDVPRAVRRTGTLPGS
jgi:hypothetical protein